MNTNQQPETAQPALNSTEKSHHSASVRTGAPNENAELRTPPLYIEDRALHWTYNRCLESNSNRLKAYSSKQLNSSSIAGPKVSNALEVGTQDKLMDAAWVGFKKGHEINTLATIRASTLQYGNCPLVSPGGYEGVKLFIGQLRRWSKRPTRRFPTAYFWTRESTDAEGEHLHIGLHLPNQYLGGFLAFLERATGEAKKGGGRNSHKKTRGEIAVGELESWHVAIDDGKGNAPFPGYWIAAYCGKSEPSQRVFRGQLVDNVRKPERGREFGGRLARRNYDAPQGTIEGNHARKGRFTISRGLS